MTMHPELESAIKTELSIPERKLWDVYYGRQLNTSPGSN
jgi:hypothetical protein